MRLPCWAILLYKEGSPDSAATVITIIYAENRISSKSISGGKFCYKLSSCKIANTIFYFGFLWHPLHSEIVSSLCLYLIDKKYWMEKKIMSRKERRKIRWKTVHNMEVDGLSHSHFRFLEKLTRATEFKHKGTQYPMYPSVKFDLEIFISELLREIWVKFLATSTPCTYVNHATYSRLHLLTWAISSVILIRIILECPVRNKTILQCIYTLADNHEQSWFKLSRLFLSFYSLYYSKDLCLQGAIII